MKKSNRLPIVLMGDLIKEGDRLILSDAQKCALDKCQKVGLVKRVKATGNPLAKMVTHPRILFFSLDLC